MRIHFSLLFFCFIYSAFADDLDIQLANGKIRGRIQTCKDGSTYRAWQGIPYAKPPLGELRFQAPQPAEPWDGVKDTTVDGNMCFQVKGDYPTENEDCLHVNVFAPTEVPTEKLPVMFWIYGGAFRGGSAGFDSLGPDRLIKENVIIVTHNYRVGPFGFLSTGDMVVPGNAGLKDQALALKWTYENIAAFGGDPEKITIFGESAGSASVGYQLLTPRNKGLFRAAIQESGSPLNDWASRLNPKAFVEDLINQIDPNANVGSDSWQQLQYLQSIDPHVIDLASTTTADLTLPVLEPEHDDAFVSTEMYEAYESGNFNQVPLMIGFNSEEDIFMVQSNKYVLETGRAYDADILTIVPPRLISDTDRYEIAQEIKSIYLNPDEKFGENEPAVVMFNSDIGFNRGVLKEAELVSRFQNVFFYKLSYDGQLGGWDKTLPGTDGNVTHGEDIYYLWTYRGSHSTEDLSTFPLSDQINSQRMVKMWTNFAKYLNPTPEQSELLQNVVWPSLKEGYRQYLDIDTDLQVKVDPKPTYNQWKTIYEKYAKRPYNTY